MHENANPQHILLYVSDYKTALCTREVCGCLYESGIEPLSIFGTNFKIFGNIFCLIYFIS